MSTVEKYQKLTQWVAAAKTLKEAKKAESVLRKEVFGEFFPMPEEGVNEVDLEQGYRLKATHKITRNLDEPALAAVFEKLPDGSKDKLIKEKPSLILTAYKKLSKKNRKVFDMALTIKDGTPTLEVVAPKDK